MGTRRSAHLGASLVEQREFADWLEPDVAGVLDGDRHDRLPGNHLVGRPADPQRRRSPARDGDDHRDGLADDLVEGDISAAAQDGLVVLEDQARDVLAGLRRRRHADRERCRRFESAARARTSLG